MSFDDSTSTPHERRLSARLTSIAESATLAVDAKAKALAAQGEDVIGFGAGEPDFPTPEHIVEAAIAAARDPKNHRYSPATGLPELKEAIAHQTYESDRVRVDASRIIVTNGGKQAVYEALAALLDPGDEAILPAPYWTTYPEAVRLAGGVPVAVRVGADQGYIPSIEQLEAARTPRSKVVLLCSPSNPTGAVMSRAQVEEFGRWALENDLWVLSDEIYQRLVYDGATFHSILDVVPELEDRTILVNGVAKTFAMTGWRVGWLIAPPDIAQGVARLQSHLTSNVNNVAQRAAIAALTGPTEPLDTMREAFDRRRRTMVDMLSEIEGLTLPTPRGAFYAFPDVTGLLGREIDGTRVTTSAELAALILERAKVALVPGEAFDAPGHLRLSYALSDADLAKGVARLQKVLG
ncbi:pyridoxal phosphate-dependent aminotransferase [Dermabacter hominis]|uniref:pyridoxal phosphate-dependent aminotransferase n=1 Tax=Dermabacter hominis TaxID=36740 RepID=UPI0021A392EE|nr:pyridoxal phosphate-dependent aminotransferase [Dermabacter hominis]MCT1956354.1 pyridoxal phosphate-dependent aminotransferase [Dermabacter hominis]